ncbi:MAG: DNA repair protein RadA [Verrucomicrobia bacterium]|nr:DNA repair protein RadA [Verrucomicrobiota bacterium]
MAKTKALWACKECGHVQIKWAGSCPACRQWNTLTEETPIEDVASRFAVDSLEKPRPLRISEVQVGVFPRLATGFKEFDRVLGGGIVRGSLTLIAGDPGIGKSTLLLQVAESASSQDKTVLYIAGEESVEQTALRAKRLGIESQKLFILSETQFTSIKAEVEKLKPDILIVDSIQILYKPEISSSPGSVSQVRELAMEFMHLSKKLGIATFLVGHVTKSGEIAGPRVLEHIVDTVLEFEGDFHQGYRMLRAIKNRFGPTEDIVLFQMGISGLVEVEDPSHVFLQERKKGSAGSVIIPTLEGSRAVLIEAQSLVAPSPFPSATRKSAGIDPNRLALLLAVLEKKAGYQVHRCDVFVSIAGGMKIYEPAIDLGISVAILSSFCNRPIDSDTVIFGEVGLGGEVRSVAKAEARVKEALHLGFTKCILPKKNVASLSSELKNKMEIRGIETIEEAINELIQ